MKLEQVIKSGGFGGYMVESRETRGATVEASLEATVEAPVQLQKEKSHCGSG